MYSRQLHMCVLGSEERSDRGMPVGVMGVQPPGGSEVIQGGVGRKGASALH